MDIKDKINMVILLTDEMYSKMVKREKDIAYNKALIGEDRWRNYKTEEPKAGIFANGLKIRKLLIEIEKELT
jgi:hypothetical protein